MYFHWARCTSRLPQTRWSRTRSIRPGPWGRCRCRVRGLFRPPIHRRKCRHRRSRTVRPSFRWRIEMKVFASRWLLLCRMLNNYNNKKGGEFQNAGAVLWCGGVCWRWLRARIGASVGGEWEGGSRTGAGAARAVTVAVPGFFLWSSPPCLLHREEERERREETGAQSRARDAQLMTSVLQARPRLYHIHVVSHYRWANDASFSFWSSEIGRFGFARTYFLHILF